MGSGELSAAIADYLSATTESVLTCDAIAAGVFRTLGYAPSKAAVSRIVGQRSDWRRMVTGGGQVAFTKCP
jgi:hypothetical protein